MKLIERQKALEAVGWTFQIRNSQRQWVRYKGTSRRFARMLDYMEAPKRERMCAEDDCTSPFYFTLDATT